MRQRNDDNDFRVRATLVIVMMIVFAFALIVIGVRAARSSPSCMTKAEARARYNTSHLYWHTEHHCWNDQRGRVGRKAMMIALPRTRPVAVDANGHPVDSMEYRRAQFLNLWTASPMSHWERIYEENEFNPIDEQAE